MNGCIERAFHVVAWIIAVTAVGFAWFRGSQLEDMRQYTRGVLKDLDACRKPGASPPPVER